MSQMSKRPAMGDEPRDALSAREFIANMRALGSARAPETVAHSALISAGLADAYTTIETALGTVYVAWSEVGLSVVTRSDSAEAFKAAASALLGRPVYELPTPPERMMRALTAWLAGDRRAPLRFDLRAQSEFTRAALLKAREIPYGEVRPYSWIAREIGHPGATRAVGTAMARNPVPLFIPCHRVVRADGRLGAYSMGGPESKRRILSAEGLDVAQLEALAGSGVRYIGSASGDSYCYPTCRHAQRIGDAHRVSFTSEAEAQAAGYRPCNVCRPPTARRAS